RALEPRSGNRALDGLHDGGRVLNGAVRDGIRGKGCYPQRGQRVRPARLLDVDGLHTARPDVEAENIRRLAEERHIKRLSPCWLCSIGRPPSGGPVFSHLLHSGGYRPPPPRPWNALSQAWGTRPRRHNPAEGWSSQKLANAGWSGRVFRSLGARRSRRSLIGPILSRHESTPQCVLNEAKSLGAV